MGKPGRPHLKGGSDKTRRLRKQWCEASARYYKKNRKKILRRSKRRGGKK